MFFLISLRTRSVGQHQDGGILRRWQKSENYCRRELIFSVRTLHADNHLLRPIVAIIVFVFCLSAFPGRRHRAVQLSRNSQSLAQRTSSTPPLLRTGYGLTARRCLRPEAIGVKESSKGSTSWTTCRPYSGPLPAKSSRLAQRRL